MRKNFMMINEEALEQVNGGGGVPGYLRLPDVLCDDCGDNEELYIQEYYEKYNIGVISCHRCGEGFYWDYNIDDYGSCPFPH